MLNVPLTFSALALQLSQAIMAIVPEWEKSKAMRRARELLAHIFMVSPLKMLCQMNEPFYLSPLHRSDLMNLFALKNRDIAYAPVSRLTGRAFFYGQFFALNEATLDPRWETEGLIDLVLGFITKEQEGIIADLGTGTGCILLSLLGQRPKLKGIGVDISSRALQASKQNAAALNLEDQVAWYLGDWFLGWTEHALQNGPLDGIVSNPPYIAHDTPLPEDVLAWDPSLALYAHEDGLACYKILVHTSGQFLKPNGFIAFEIGHNQGADVAQLLCHGGFVRISIHQDADGKERYVVGWMG